MSAREYRSPDGAARALAQLLRTDAVSRVASEPPRDAELERLLRTVELGAPRRRSVWGALLVAAAFVLCLGLGFAYRQAHQALRFSVDGATARDGARIAAPSDRVAALEFTDGSRFDVQPAAELVVEASSATGSRLRLVGGKAVAHVVHRDKSSWAVDAGPFQIQVTGTRFGAAWDAERGRLVVELYEGSVQVVGKAFGAPVVVRSGQRLEAGSGPGDWVLSSLNGPGSASPPAASALPSQRNTSDANEPNGATEPPTNEPLAKDDARPALAASARPAHDGFDWPALVQRADFDGIVRQAQDYGIERCLASCAPGDLRILADAARYSGRAPLAERALLALRKRAPSEAATAAFLLARLDESRGEVSEALRWYEQHLQEAPSSVYAAEALAGKMRLLQRTAGTAAARATAEQYLARFPNGVQADQARRILADGSK